MRGGALDGGGEDDDSRLTPVERDSVSGLSGRARARRGYGRGQSSFSGMTTTKFTDGVEMVGGGAREGKEEGCRRRRVIMDAGEAPGCLASA